MSSSTKKNKGSTFPGSATHHRHQQEFQDYLPVIQRAQDDLKADIAELQDQEGWNEDIAEGIREWSDDINTIWRVLRVSLSISWSDEAAKLTYTAASVRHRQSTRGTVDDRRQEGIDGPT